jgi:hypothetical protein
MVQHGTWTLTCHALPQQSTESTKLTVGKGLCGGRCTILLLPGTLALKNASVVGLHTYTVVHVWKLGCSEKRCHTSDGLEWLVSAIQKRQRKEYQHLQQHI